MNRSLLVDDPGLFSLALRLYATRNRIAHRGEPGGEASQVLALDLDGARQALDCAIRVFAWYGEGRGYYLPSRETVPGVLLDDRTLPPTAPVAAIDLGTMVLNTGMVEVIASLSEEAAAEILGRQGITIPESD